MRRPALAVLAAVLLAALPAVAFASGEGPPLREDTRQVMFVGNNWEGTATLVDSRTHEVLGELNTRPDAQQELQDIATSPDRLAFYQAIQAGIGEGNNQYVDDMFTNHAGTEVYVSRPSFADMVAISLETGEIVWEFDFPTAPEGNSYRADHAGISPDGSRVLVSDSTGNVIHVLDTATGEEVATVPSGDSPHENIFFRGGDALIHASIGRVYTPIDRPAFREARDTAQGDRRLQVVDTSDWTITEQWDIGAELDEYEARATDDEQGEDRSEMSAAVRPLAVHPDQERVFFQVSFHFGYVEFDLTSGQVLDVVDLPEGPDAEGVPPEQYVLDSAHHGLALSPDGSTLCVAGTQSGYAALVDAENPDIGDPTSYAEPAAGSKPYWSTIGRFGETCWVSWSGDDEVSVIALPEPTEAGTVDVSQGREVARVPVGDHPQRVRAGAIREDLLAAGAIVPAGCVPDPAIPVAADLLDPLGLGDSEPEQPDDEVCAAGTDDPQPAPDTGTDDTSAAAAGDDVGADDDGAGLAATGGGAVGLGVVSVALAVGLRRRRRSASG